MAIPGQRFQLDLDEDNFTFNPISDNAAQEELSNFGIRDIQEHDTTAPPPAPSLRASKSGFPEHKQRPKASAFKQRNKAGGSVFSATSSKVEPSDQAIRHHVGKKYGLDMDAQQKADIGEENKRRIEEMSIEDIEEARAELTRSLNPEFLQRLLKRANIEEDHAEQQRWHESDGQRSDDKQVVDNDVDSLSDTREEDITHQTNETPPPSFHFPVPPRSADTYQPLNPDSPSFLTDLKTHYFPNTPHDPASLSWLQDPSEEEAADSQYNPSKESYLASSLRFGFNGRLIPPKESLEVDVKEGLHHHGDDPGSAGYTIPELSLLARSTLPNQRCMAYQILGRILYRLGRGDFGARGSELQEAIWSVVEKERPLEIMMSEANRQSGHASAKAHAIEALWLWRKGGGSDRGVLKPGQKLAK
jgi:RNA polymerase II-associated protein 1